MAEENSPIDNVMDFENLVDSPGWKLLFGQALNDIQQKTDAVMNGADLTIEEIRYIQGYIKGVRDLVSYPQGIIEIAQDIDKSRLVNRRNGVKQLV